MEKGLHWRLLDYSSKNPAMNLAVEEAILRYLLECNGPNTLRLWRNPPCVVVGYFQNPYSEVNIAACKKLRIPIIRRVSGGGAVYHDYGNLNYSLFMHKSILGTEMDVEKSYDLFCNGVIEGLKILGIKAYNKRGSILINKKNSGSAQYRLYDVILHHGTLMINVNLDVLKQALGISNPEKILVNLQDVVPAKISLNSIKNAIKVGFEKTLNVKFSKGTLTLKERQIANKLWKIKYSKEGWNISKCNAKEHAKDIF